MIKKLPLTAAFALMMLLYHNSQAQTAPDETAIREVINSLFKGMELGDSAMVRKAFTRSPAMATVFRNQQNEPVLRQENSLDAFLKAVGTPHKDTWYEEIWNLKIRQDGDLAQAWCDYAFYVGKNFSHCGVDAFHLHKSKDGWKIVHLADTRRKTGCEVPEEIRKKRSQEQGARSQEKSGEK